MQLDVRHGDITSVQTDTLVIDLFEGVEEPGGAAGAVDAALGGAVRELIDAGDARGRPGETSVLYPRGAVAARRVIVTGLGPRPAFATSPAARGSASTSAGAPGRASTAWGRSSPSRRGAPTSPPSSPWR